MTEQSAADDRIRRWLAEEAPSAPPPHLLARVLATSSVTARRPAWWRPRLSGLEPAWGGRWLIPAIRGAAVVALLAAALLALLGTSLIIGSRPQVPLPPGRPGLLVASRDGAVVTLDPVTMAIRSSYPTNVGLTYAAWSPDGTKVALWLQSDGETSLVVTDPDLQEQFRIASGGTADLWPAWSPDGKQIAFGVSNEFGSAIAVVQATAGATPVRITETALAALVPAWSPDGSLIAFRGGVGSAEEALYVVRPDGSAVRRLSKGGRGVSTGCPPAWSPDATRILYFTRQYDIWSVHPDGSGEVALIAAGRFEYCPSWSPDGRRIALAAWLDTGKYVVVVDAAGGNEVVPDGPLYNDMLPILWAPDGSRLVANGRVLDGGINPTAVLDPMGTLPGVARPLDVLVMGWQRLPP